MTTATTGHKARTGFTGMFAWLVQRASAVYLLLCVVSLLVFFLMRPVHSYAEWKGWVARPAVTLGLALFFAALLAHMWVGLRDVLLDYARPARLRQVLLWLVALGLCTGAASMAWLLASQHL